MNEIVKQRLVGALILLALGVVFWPIIFVDPDGGRESGELVVPPRPQVDTTTIDPPHSSGVRPAPEPLREPVEAPFEAKPLAEQAPEPEPEPEPEVAAPPAPGETRDEPPLRPSLDQQGIPIAWVLQVASVSESARADTLRGELLEMGYKAYVKRVRNGDKTLYRICIGPEVEKAGLESIRAAVDNRFGVESLVTRYYP